ncbi:MAG: type 4a pilus biogenesis protein PilO [Candidatus Margulisiibacteriota bacterium]|jgi:Tfp pilus assembly protein PilO
MGIKEDLQQTPLWQKIVLVFLTLVLILGGLKNYVIKDKPRQVKQLKRDLRRIESDLINKKSAAEDYEFVLKQQTDLQDQVAKKLPSLKRTLALLGQLIQNGSAIDISFTLVEPGQMLDQGGYGKLPLNLKVHGSLNNIGAFIRMLENSQLRSEYQGLSIRQIGEADYQADMSLLFLVSKTSGGAEDDLAEIAPPTPSAKVARQQTAAKPKANTKKPSGLVLSGFWNGKTKKAFINDKLVSAGQGINGYTVSAINIHEKNVILIKGNEKKILQMKE